MLVNRQIKMRIENFKNIFVTYQKQYWNQLEVKTLEDVFLELRSSKHEEFTRQLRKLYLEGDIENYSIKKKYLPVVTFSALFDGDRKKTAIKNYNQILVLDIDKLGSEKLKAVIDAFESDNFVFAFWKSPSNDGIKGLIELKFEINFENDENSIDTIHKSAFEKVKNYFYNEYQIELDQSGKDFTRLCFIAWDEMVTIKKSADGFLIEEKEIIETKKTIKRNSGASIAVLNSKTKNILNNPLLKNKPQNRKLIGNIITYLKYSNKSITNSYDNWIRVAFAIANTFTYDVGVKYFVELSQLDAIKFNKEECESLLTDCYMNSKGLINFNTITYFAKDQGYKLYEEAKKST